MPQPETMEPAELRVIRGLVGARLGYDGPMPRKYFCHWLCVSERSLYAYERGHTTIPPLVAKEAKRLRDDQTLELPKEWKRRQGVLRARKERYRKLVADRDRRIAAESKTPDPPF